MQYWKFCCKILDKQVHYRVNTQQGVYSTGGCLEVFGREVSVVQQSSSSSSSAICLSYIVSNSFRQLVSLTLKVLVTTIDAQWEGMGDVGSARYEPALLPPCPTIQVLSYSN